MLPLWHSPNISQEWSQSITEKSHFADDPCHGVQSQPGIPDKDLVCLGDLTQRNSLWVDSELLLYLWCRYINGHKWCRYIIGTPVPGTVVAGFCFPRKSVCYCGFFVLISGSEMCISRMCRPPSQADTLLCQYFSIITGLPLWLLHHWVCSILRKEGSRGPYCFLQVPNKGVRRKQNQIFH